MDSATFGTGEREQEVTRIAANLAGAAPPVSPLVDAFTRVARHAGIGLDAPPLAARQCTVTVELLAQSAGIRVRRVALRGRWWRTDSGPLVASMAGSGEWVALIPDRKGGSYRMYRDGCASHVDEALANLLSGFAYSLYRPPPDGRFSLRSLAAFSLRGLGREIRMLGALGLALMLLGLAMPVASAIMIDRVIPSALPAQAWELSAVLAVVAAAACALELVRSLILIRIETRMDGTMQAAMWDRMLRLPVPFFRRFAVGDLAARLHSIEELRRALSGNGIAALLGGAFSLGNFALLAYYSQKLALAAAQYAAVIVASIAAIGYFKLRAEREVAGRNGRIAGKTLEYLSSISKLRVAAAEARAFANWAGLFADARRLAFRACRLGAVDEVFAAGYPILGSAMLFALAGAALGPGDGTAGLSTGQFVAFHAAFGTFLSGLAGVATTVLGLLRLVPLAERAGPVLDALPEVAEGKRDPGRLQGRIDVRGLSFRYGEGPDVLADVDLSIAPGSFVAIVGPSGSGKSTLLRLLLGFEPPRAGTIAYDGQDLAALDVTAVRRQLGVVLQHGQLLSGTIFQNIACARDLAPAQAEEAARLCALEEDLLQMPMGMHTLVSEGCSTLSGGQQQRILIARAIAHRPDILLFDEATSALDNRTQAQIAHGLGQIRATRVVVAHRLSTIAQADQIFVLDQGHVVQRGTYQELLAQPGLFAELARRQIA